ncbi:Uncharacterised protein [Staphylococcus saccharolyticus]|uniref:Uncharacterized protein n=1 Tax=Staphylococcus saccharolyticus TaxID=33028 RepID=A0A380HBI4_9STAP|nr:Uncharacterised protein [Staphylococcus saccharolyticus]
MLRISMTKSYIIVDINSPCALKFSKMFATADSKISITELIKNGHQKSRRLERPFNLKKFSQNNL